jgi:hypothetical protein
MRLLLFLFLIFASLNSHAQNYGKYLVEHEEFVYQDKTYHLLTIEARDTDAIIFPGPGPDFENWVDRVLDRAWIWILDQYVDQQRFTRESHIYKNLSTKETLVDSRSKIQILLDGNQMNNIAAIMRTAKRGSASDKFVSIEQRRDRRISDLVGTENYLEWKNFIKRVDVPSSLTGILLEEAVKKNFFDFTLGGQPVEVVVGETYAGKVFYFMDVYGFKIVDYEEVDVQEAGYRAKLLEQVRQERLDPAFVRSLKGFFTIAVPRKTLLARIQVEVFKRMTLDPPLQKVRLLKKPIQPKKALLCQPHFMQGSKAVTLF